MAKEVTIRDDIDGSAPATTWKFSGGEYRWEIDLSDANIEKFWEALAPFIDRARSLNPQPKAPRADGVEVDQGVVRAWAVQQGMEVNAKGRVPAGLIEQYLAAQAA